MTDALWFLRINVDTLDMSFDEALSYCRSLQEIISSVDGIRPESSARINNEHDLVVQLAGTKKQLHAVLSAWHYADGAPCSYEEDEIDFVPTSIDELESDGTPFEFIEDLDYVDEFTG